MKTFEEAVKILNADNVEKFSVNHKEMWENLKQEPAFQDIIRMTLDEVVCRMIIQRSPASAITAGLVSVAQTFLMLGIEMEKE